MWIDYVDPSSCVCVHTPINKCACVCGGINIVSVEWRSQFRAPGPFRPWQRLPPERGSRRSSLLPARERGSRCLSDFSFHRIQNTFTNVNKNMDICFLCFHGVWGRGRLGEMDNLTLKSEGFMTFYQLLDWFILTWASFWQFFCQQTGYFDQTLSDIFINWGHF